MSVSASPYALCSLEEVRTLLGYGDDETKRDDAAQRAINGASTAIARRAQRAFKVPAADNVTTKPRFARITPADVKRGYVRVGDMHGAPTEVALLTPNRNGSADPYVLTTDDFWLLPDFPEPGMPYESINVIEGSSTPLQAGWWMRVKSTNWGFVSVPEDIIECTVACAAAFVLNDATKQSELAAQAGRRLKIDSIILPEWEDVVDEYRIYRVS